jgi:hypothetical protein
MKTPLHLYFQLENQILADFHSGKIDVQTTIHDLMIEREQIDWDPDSFLPLGFMGEGIS